MFELLSLVIAYLIVTKFQYAMANFNSSDRILTRQKINMISLGVIGYVGDSVQGVRATCYE